MSANPISDHLFGKIVLPTDFSDTSHIAFEHALAITLAATSRFDLLHVDQKDDGKDEWDGFPPVRKTLASWGVDPAVLQGDPEEGKGIAVRKVEVKDYFAGSAIISFLEKKPCDLIVMATRGHKGLGEWLTGSVTGKVVRDSNRPTLLFGPESKGFVDNATGKIDLSNIMVAISHEPDPQVAFDTAAMWGDVLGNEKTTISTLHVSDDGTSPNVEPTERWKSRYNGLIVDGSPATAICETAKQKNSDLIVVTTEGHDSYLDILTGNITEEIVQSAPCPVLAIPAANYSGPKA